MRLIKILGRPFGNFLRLNRHETAGAGLPPAVQLRRGLLPSSCCTKSGLSSNFTGSGNHINNAFRNTRTHERTNEQMHSRTNKRTKERKHAHTHRPARYILRKRSVKRFMPDIIFTTLQNTENAENYV